MAIGETIDTLEWIKEAALNRLGQETEVYLCYSKLFGERFFRLKDVKNGKRRLGISGLQIDRVKHEARVLPSIKIPLNPNVTNRKWIHDLGSWGEGGIEFLPVELDLSRIISREEYQIAKRRVLKINRRTK